MAAVTSAVPQLAKYQVWLAVACIVFIALANLRGAKESGLLFAVPTYLFITSILALLVVGFWRLLSGSPMTPPQPPGGLAAHHGELQALNLFLILRAFSSGCTALTGVEAVTDGVPAFKPPEAKNAAKVFQRAVATESMPLGNETRMTAAEREQLGAWIQAGSKTSP